MPAISTAQGESNRFAVRCDGDPEASRTPRVLKDINRVYVRMKLFIESNRVKLAVI